MLHLNICITFTVTGPNKFHMANLLLHHKHQKDGNKHCLLISTQFYISDRYRCLKKEMTDISVYTDGGK